MQCTDKSLTFLANLGYNVVRRPDATFAPLKLLGHQSKEFMILGSLDQLVCSSTAPLPAVTADQPCADVNGQRSSSLQLGLGVNVLSSLIGAMGGNLSTSLKYTDASNIEFQYQDVLADAITPLDVGNYLKGAEVDASNLLLKQYVIGNGELYLITKIVKSSKFTVKYTKSNSTDASVNVPIIQAAVGGSLSVGVSGASNSNLTFAGKVPLPFGFQCFRIGVKDGVLDMVSTKAGSVFGFAGEPEPAVLASGLLDIRVH